MKKLLWLIVLLASTAWAQFQPNQLTPFQPYQPQPPQIAGFRVQIAKGSVNVGTQVIVVPSGTVYVAANATTYIYLDTTLATVTSNTSGFASTGQYPIAVATTNSTFVTTLIDARPNVFISGTGGGGGGGNVVGPNSSTILNLACWNNSSGTSLSDCGFSLPLPNSGLQNSSITVNAGAGLQGGGSLALGGNVTVSMLTSCAIGQVLQWTGTWACATISGGGGNPGGSNTQVQFNNVGAFGGDSTLTFNSTSKTLIGQNFEATNQIKVDTPYAVAAGVPVNPLCANTSQSAACAITGSSFNPPLGLGTTGFGINNDGQFAICANGGPCVDVPTSAGNLVSQVGITAQRVVQQQAVAGTNPTLPLDANNFANIRYVTPSYNWLQSPAGTITAGSNTITLTPCPIGIDTASAANHYVYRVYIGNVSSGTPEAATITGGSCTSGLATGNITFTAATNHSAGYTLGSSTGGIQEAWNDAWVNDSGAPPIANTSSAPYVKLEADTNYNVYSSIYMRGRGGILDGAGAYLICATRDRCVYIGTNASLAAVTYHRIYNLNGGSTVVQDGVQVVSAAASAGTYTITTASTHTFVVGDTIDCYYNSQSAVQHWVAVATAPTSGTTITAVVTGGLTIIPGANTFGWCNILNAFIEDNSDHVDMKTVNIFTSTTAPGAFSYGIVNDNDQQLQIDHLSNRSKAVLQSAISVVTANYPIGAMVFSRYDQGNAGISYIHNSEFTSVNCGVSGGNGFIVDNTVCQNFPLFGFQYFGGLQPISVTNVYMDVSSDNPLYHAQYSQAVPGPMGYLVQGGRGSNVSGMFPPLNQVVKFPCTAGAGAERDYWVIPHTTAGSTPGAGSPLFIGYATGCDSSSITVSWPSVSLQDWTNVSIGALTWDVLVTSGAAQAPFGTGNYYLTVFNTPVDGLCNHGGLCHFVDTQPGTPNSGTIPSQVFQPNFWFWPGSYAINRGSALHVNSVDTTPLAVGSFGTQITSINADQCIVSGTAARRTPLIVSCEGVSGSTGQGTVAQIVGQLDSTASGNGPAANSKGRLNFGRTMPTTPNDLVTLVDSNFAKTASFAGGRPSNDAGDMAIGLDQANGFSLRANTSISNYIGIVQDNASYKERLTSALKTFTLPVTITGASSTLTVAGNETFNGGTFQNNGVSQLNGVNTVGSAGTFDATAVTTANGTKPMQIKAGCTAGADGAMCYDSTGKLVHIRSNGADSLAAATTATSTTTSDLLHATAVAGVYAPSGLQTSEVPPVNLPAAGTSISLSGPSEIYICSGTCTVTPPAPVAGYQFCVFNGDNVATVITMAALGSSARYETTARTSYGTAGTGTMVSTGAVKDFVCIVGIDATHYITSNFTGTWTVN